MPLDSAFLDRLNRLGQVDEVKYLVFDNAPIYRGIVGFLYERYEASETGWVWPTEIVDFMRREHAEGSSYDESFCRSHLEQLEAWGVVTSEQDLENVRTLREFVAQSRRYQITERARLVEEFVRQLEADDPTRGSLEVGRIRRLWEALTEIDRLLKTNTIGWGSTALRELEEHWTAADDARREIRAEALRYMSQLNDERLIDLADSRSFGVYKELLRTYVGGFHLALQNFRSRSHGLFEEWKKADAVDHLIDGLVQMEQRRKGDLHDRDRLSDFYRGHLKALTGFSAPDGTARILEDKTLGRLLALISRIERVVLERRTIGDRRRDLEQLALAFRRAPSDEFAHELAGVVLGLGCPQHQARYSLAESDVRSHESVWLQEPDLVELRRAARGNRTFQAISPVRDRSAERARLRRNRALERARERAFWDELFAEGEIVVAGLEFPDPTSLNRVWRAVRSCLRDPDRKVRLTDGSTLRIQGPVNGEVGEMRCPGGTLHVRPFRLTREAPRA